MTDPSTPAPDASDDHPITRPDDPDAGTGRRPGAEHAEDPITTRRQRDEYYDLLLRKTAEFDNYRKRIERERQEFAESAAADLLTELLPLVDDLERALAVEIDGGQAKAYRDGVELIQRQLVDLLAKRGVRPIDAVGQPFDPHFHQAVVRERSGEYPEGVVVADLRRGYMLGGRLLRAAMVKVASA
jgi:molecular chaperone GrpE